MCCLLACYRLAKKRKKKARKGEKENRGHEIASVSESRVRWQSEAAPKRLFSKTLNNYLILRLKSVGRRETSEDCQHISVIGILSLGKV